MEFTQFIDTAWADHATETQSVFNRLADGEKLIRSNDDIPVLARLITHVCGDHLGAWKIGIEKLRNLKANSFYAPGTESEFAITRLTSTLQFCSGELKDLNSFSVSDQIRIFAQAAGMLTEQGQLSLATEYFQQAIKLADRGVEAKDPANRALAITGNNLSCTLEEKLNRSAPETELMILAAQTGRKFWEVAGGPSEVSSAEYRLSQSYLQAGQPEKSLEHAKLSLRACTESSPESDYRYANEAIALAEKALAEKKR